jgi:hypothetical protein
MKPVYGFNSLPIGGSIEILLEKEKIKITRKESGKKNL